MLIHRKKCVSVYIRLRPTDLVQSWLNWLLKMDLLKQPWSADLPDPKGGIAQKMCFAVRGSGIFVTPMAAVAGAVADEVLEALLYEAKNHDSCLEEIQRMYVNNGGDIAFWLNTGESFSIGVVDNPGIPELNARVSLADESPVRGIATSGWRGRSQSLGIADAVTVLAGSAAIADAAATLIANDVNVDYPGILKRPASEVKDESDLGMLPVTVDVPPLPVDQISESTQTGSADCWEFYSDRKNRSCLSFFAEANTCCRKQSKKGIK